MTDTTFVNKTTIDFKLKERNAGVFREIAVLKGVDMNGKPRLPDGQFTVAVDGHATYKEFILIGLPTVVKTKRILFSISLDMCLDISVIDIIMNDTTGDFEID